MLPIAGSIIANPKKGEKLPTTGSSSGCTCHQASRQDSSWGQKSFCNCLKEKLSQMPISIPVVLVILIVLSWYLPTWAYQGLLRNLTRAIAPSTKYYLCHSTSAYKANSLINFPHSDPCHWSTIYLEEENLSRFILFSSYIFTSCQNKSIFHLSLHKFAQEQAFRNSGEQRFVCNNQWRRGAKKKKKNSNRCHSFICLRDLVLRTSLWFGQN